MNTKHRCSKSSPQGTPHGDREVVYIRPKGKFERITKRITPELQQDPKFKNFGEGYLICLYFCQSCFDEGNNPLTWGYCRE